MCSSKKTSDARCLTIETKIVKGDYTTTSYGLLNFRLGINDFKESLLYNYSEQL